MPLSEEVLINFIKLIVILLLFDAKLTEAVLPPNLPICYRDDPQLSDCIVKAVEAIAPRLAKGDLGGGYNVPPLEPFHIKEVHFGENQGLKVHISDMYIHGTSKFKIQKLRANALDGKFDVLVGLPLLDVRAKYKMSLKFLGTEVKSQGDYYIQFSDAKIRLNLKGHKYLKNGKQYVKFEPFGVKFNRGKVNQLKIGNLFGGNKVMGDIVHRIILNNPDFVLSNVYPSLEALLSKHFTNLANSIIEHATYDEMFPLNSNSHKKI